MTFNATNRDRAISLRDTLALLAAVSLPTVLFMSACGSKSTDISSDGEFVTSTSAQDETFGDQNNEMTEALSEDTGSGSSFFTLEKDESFSALASVSPTRRNNAQATGRTCVENDTGVVVTRSSDTSGKGSVIFGTASFNTEFKYTGSLTHTWVKGKGSKMTCTSASGIAKIDFSTADNIDGAKLTADVDRKASLTATGSNSKTNQTHSFNSDITVKGKRTVAWGRPSLEATTNVVTAEMTLTSNVTRTISGKNLRGEVINLNVNSEIKEQTPMVVATSRSALTGTWTTKTVKSGTLVSTNNSDGSRIESKFENVIYIKGSCLPSSGKITRQAFAKGGTEAKASAIITFGQTTESTVSIARNGGAPEDFTDFVEKVIRCDL